MKLCRWSLFAALLATQTAFASDAELQAVQNAIHGKGAHWNAKKNSVSELPDSERKGHLGLLKNGAEAPASTLSGSGTSTVTAAPAAMDWRNVNGVNYVTPVKNQGSCGSCWAFSTTAGLESQVLLSQGVPMDLSEQVMLSCSGAGSCNGGYPSSASAYLVSTGLPDETNDPYTATDSACSLALTGWQNLTQKIWSYLGVSQSAAALETAIATYGPVVTTFAVYNDFYYYGGGVYSYTSGALAGYHAVLIVGYDHANQYFVVKNSWGSGWGEGGYFRIAYSQISNSVGFGAGSLAYYTSTAAPSISVVSPNGGENLVAGTTATIKWAYQGSPGSSVAIQLLQGGVVLQTLSAAAPLGSNGSGSYNWAIPAGIATGSNFRISVTSTANAAYASTSGADFSISPAPPPPSAPALAYNLKTQTKGHKTTVTVQLTWSAASSAAGIQSYTVFRNGAAVATTTSLSYNDTSTSAGNTYTYTVQATDKLGQKSGMSNTVSVVR